MQAEGNKKTYFSSGWYVLEDFLMEKVIGLIKANLSLALAFIASLLCYLCLCGPAFGYSTDEAEFVYSFTGIIELLPSSFGAFIYIALILPGLGAVLLGLYTLHRYFGFAGMAVLFADAIFTFFLSDFITAGAGLDYSFSPELWGSWLPALCLVAGCFALLQVSSSEKLSIRDIAEMGMLIGMAFVLNLFRLFAIGADGGSVNLQMVPLFVLALRRGPVKGFIACGLVYGLLTCITDGYGFASFPFDYLLGFGSTCILGFFRPLIFGRPNEEGKPRGYNLKGELFILFAGVLATLGRFIGSTISSLVVYGYTFEASLVYNATYIPLSGLFAIVVLMALYGPLIQLERLFPVARREIGSAN